MPTLEELKKKYNIQSGNGPANGPRAKLLAQVNRMLNELAKYKTEAELDGTNTQYWWAPQSVNGQRRISMRYFDEFRDVAPLEAILHQTKNSCPFTVQRFI